MGRPRKHAHRSWPAGLYERKKSALTYYIYRGSAAPKEIYLGTDLRAAIQAVGLVNAKRAVEPVQAVIARIERPARTVRDFVGWYQANILAEKRSRVGKPLSDTTLLLYKYLLGQFVDKHGSAAVDQVERRAIADFLRGFPAQTSNKYRSLLKQLFDSARAEGLREDNPVEGTAKRAFVVQHQRLPKAAFDAILAASPAWFARALTLAFWSLQRREDLVFMSIDNWQDGKLSVRQRKVEGHGTGLLRIAPGANLRAAVIACLNSPERVIDGDECPYLLHRIPEKRRKAKGRAHFGQLAPEMLSREFQRVRDDLKLFDALPMAQRPTFREIRALGADHYKTVLGWPEDRVQALLGHTEASMTKVYLGRHGDRWQEVDAA